MSREARPGVALACRAGASSGDGEKAAQSRYGEAMNNETNELTDSQCDEFRRLPLRFNDMVREIYSAGRASAATQAAPEPPQVLYSYEYAHENGGWFTAWTADEPILREGSTRNLRKWFASAAPVVPPVAQAEAPSGGVVWTPEDEARLDAAIARRNAKRVPPVALPANVLGRWNVEEDGDDLLVCFNDHDKGEKCEYVRYRRAEPVALPALTDEQIDAVTSDYFEGTGPMQREVYRGFARAILAASAAPAPMQLSEDEQREVFRNPRMLAALMDYHDFQQTQADAIEIGCNGNDIRREELKALGRLIIEQDPEIWDDDTRRTFGFAPAQPAAAAPTEKAYFLQHCQEGGSLCRAGQRDGVTCPEESCDIDDGTRPADEPAGYFKHEDGVWHEYHPGEPGVTPLYRAPR